MLLELNKPDSPRGEPDLFQRKTPGKLPSQSEKQFSGCTTGADYWTRTNDLLITNELLYQLS
jgi:hypothetical protein